MKVRVINYLKKQKHRFKRAFIRDGYFGLLKLLYIHVFRNIKRKIISCCLLPFSIPVSLLILTIRPWIKIRLLRLPSNFIGHYAWNTEFWLCALDKSQAPAIKTFFYTIPGLPICNQQLHVMWKRTISILPFPYLIDEIDKYLMRWNVNYRNETFKSFFRFGSWDAWNLLGKIKEPYLQFTHSELAQGSELLQKLGVPMGESFVCLVGRDSLYHKLHMPKHDLSYNAYRNVDINSYKKAAEYLANKGYYVIRLGKYVESTFDVDHARVIDYANTKFRSDFGDVYLGANCAFFVSVGTGIDAIGEIFRRPIIQTNLPGFDGHLEPNRLLFITKKFINFKTNKYLTSADIARIFPYDKVDRGRAYSKIMQENSIKIVDNSPEEILEVVKEGVERLTGTWISTDEDEYLQKEYWLNFKDPGVTLLSAKPPVINESTLKFPVLEGQNIDINRKIGHVKIRVGTDFLRKNRSWLFESHTVLCDFV